MRKIYFCKNQKQKIKNALLELTDQTSIDNIQLIKTSKEAKKIMNNLYIFPIDITNIIMSYNEEIIDIKMTFFKQYDGIFVNVLYNSSCLLTLHFVNEHCNIFILTSVRNIVKFVFSIFDKYEQEAKQNEKYNNFIKDMNKKQNMADVKEIINTSYNKKKLYSRAVYGRMTEGSFFNYYMRIFYNKHNYIKQVKSNNELFSYKKGEHFNYYTQMNDIYNDNIQYFICHIGDHYQFKTMIIAIKMLVDIISSCISHIDH